MKKLLPRPVNRRKFISLLIGVSLALKCPPAIISDIVAPLRNRIHPAWLYAQYKAEWICAYKHYDPDQGVAILHKAVASRA